MVELIFIGRNSGGVVNSLEVKDVGSYGTNNVSIGITVQHNTTILYQDSIDTYSISKGGSILLSAPYNDSGILTGIYRVLFRVKNNDTGVVQEYESSQELTYIPYQQSISITANGLLSTISATDSNPYTGSTISSYELKHTSPNGAVTTTANHSLSIPSTIYAGTHTFTATVDTVWNETNIVLYDRHTLSNTQIVYKLDKDTLWGQVDSLNTLYQSKLSTNITEANRLRDKVVRCNIWQDDFNRAIEDGETLPAYTALLNINSELNTTSPTVEEIPVFTITVPEGHTHTNKLQVLDLLTNVGGDLYFNGVKVDKDTVAGLTIDTNGVAFIPYVDEDGVLSLNIVSIDLTTDLTLTGTLTLNGYNKFLKATAGVVSEADITESDLVLSDNTTNNASLSKHGLMKKLDGNASKFFNGQGEFSFVPTAASDTLASVITIVEDNTLDPATSPYSIDEGDRYIVLTTSLHPSFGTINKDMNGDAITLGVNDIVEYYLGEFRVAFDSSEALQSATAQVQLYNGQANYEWTYNVPTSEWVNRGATVLHNNRSDLNTGTGRFHHLEQPEQEAVTSIVNNNNKESKFLRDDYTFQTPTVTENEIVLSDNTSNNASTTKHGLMKKLSGSAVQFFNGEGNFAIPSLSSETLEAMLFSDVIMTNASQFYDASSITLTSGKWLITSNIICQRNTTTQTYYTARLYCTHSSYSWVAAQTSMMYPSAAHTLAGSPSAILNLNGTTTVKLQAASSGSSGNLIIASPTYNNDNSNGCTYILAVRVGEYQTESISSSVSSITWTNLGGDMYANITSNTSFYVYSSPSWVTITPSTYGNRCRIKLTAEENIDGYRTGIVRLKTVFGSQQVSIPVEQVDY